VPFRIATFALDDKFEATPSGGLKVKGRLARSGVQLYHRPDGSEVREYRPPEEVFSEDALASFKGAPLTDLHPSGPVTPENYRELERGHIGDDVRRDGDFVEATIYVQDADLVEAVQDGRRRDLSAGYAVQIEETPGEHEGERFDRIQRKPRGNHVAALPPGYGRAGTDVALRLDSSDNAITDTVAPRTGREDSRMITIRIDGVDYEIDGPDAAKLRQALERQDAAKAAELKQANAAKEEATGRADAADAKVTKLEADLTAAQAPAALEAAAEKRAALVMDARVILRDDAADFAGKTSAQIMAAALGDAAPPNASEDYLRGAFNATATAAKADAGRQDAADADLDAARIDAAAASHADGTDPMDKLEDDLAQRRADAWKTPKTAAGQN
jgi:hypothetical protein